MKFVEVSFLRLKKIWLVLFIPRLRSAIFRHGVLAGTEHKVVLDRCLMTVVDIGANRGQFALAVRALSGAKVISFEPLPEVGDIYRRVFCSDPLATLHIAAIGEKPEKKVLHLSARDDSSSLLEIGPAQSEYFPGTHEVGTREVVVGRLDQYVGKEDIIRPAMLKLDVQGYELQAIAGCSGLIDNFDYVYCECSFVELYNGQKLAGDVVAYLSNFGFRLSGVYNPSYDNRGHCIQADLLFDRAESL